MPNQRGPGQRLINFPANEEFISEIDRAIGACGYSNRSEFIRDAILEKLTACGLSIPKQIAQAPPRVRAAAKEPSRSARIFREIQGLESLDGPTEVPIPPTVIVPPKSPPPTPVGRKKSGGGG